MREASIGGCLGIAIMSASAPAQELSADQTTPDIVIEGKRVDDRSAIGTANPIAVLDAAALRGVGATSMATLLERLRSLTRSTSGAPPVMLLNGRRVADEMEIYTLPQEAIEKWEILPEDAAPRFGYPPSRRILNIITLRRFRALELNEQANTTTDGGATGLFDKGGHTRLDNGRRLTLNVQGERRLGLIERQRGIVSVGTLAAPRSLTPDNVKLRGEAAWRTPVARDIDAAVTASGERSVDRTLRGGAVAQTRQVRVSTTRQASAALTGRTRGWNWSATGNAARTVGTVRSEGPDAPLLGDTRSLTRTLTAKVAIDGTVAGLPAGPATLAATAELENAPNRQSAISAFGVRATAIDRRSRAAGTTVSIPIASAREGVLAPLGELSATVSGGVSRVIGYGSFPRGSVSLNWQPGRRVNVALTIDRQQAAPQASFLYDPVRLEPNTPFFDYRTGQTRFVDAVSGGNPLLAPERQRRTTLSVGLPPSEKQSWGVTLAYADTDVRDQAATVSTSTPLVEAAFPGLFVRDAGGTVVRTDYRPVNLARERRRELTADLMISKMLGTPPPPPTPPVAGQPPVPPPPPPPPPGWIFASVRPTLRLEDTLELRTGLPTLDLLDGQAIGGAGGRPRFEMQGFASISKGPVSFNVDGTWVTATRVRSPLPASDLRFSGLATMGGNVVARIDQMTRAAWAKRMLVVFDVRNVFNTRQRVRDGNGATPLGYQPAYLDPLGRTVMVNVRKLF